MSKSLPIALAWLLYFPPTVAQTLKPDSLNRFVINFQLTGISQSHPAFNAPYGGQNSQISEATEAFSVTSTLFIGYRLWRGGALYVNPEMAGGRGVGKTLGIAGFPNGETFRIGNPEPVPYLARAFFRQHFSLRGRGDQARTPTQFKGASLNQVAEYVPDHRFTLTVGKFSLADVFDGNSYSHDPRSQFMNWALMSNGAWDYPANTRGYTLGIIGELVTPRIALRASGALVPQIANLSQLDFNVSKVNGFVLEVEKPVLVFKRKGIIRLLVFNNKTRGGVYKTAIDKWVASGYTDSLSVNVSDPRDAQGAYIYNGATKYGVGINTELALSKDVGIFAKYSWNDGRSASWVFAEIDRSLNGGISIKGARWKRGNDVFGAGLVINGLSPDHRDFLSVGGYGFMIGDGKLTYGTENIFETYYKATINSSLHLSLNYQLIQNPAYNKDRGPIQLWALRVHVDY
ncbi:carbohydrate porin [Spirosoma linguale]|uniref:Carbohydrate-selective porin OprB n=1 Tax=Spirosoma linguale (strain ATCC 33905 / DSM 74 / LMG 10896 / Claus 1) TaxID=504472 RepID=D2QVB5_SPILD|nr:Carbohydrate-selective porin OprB [Spirosoma linguale DSM 74]